MTNKEYALAQLGFEPPKNTIEAALLDVGIALNTVYDGTDSAVRISIKTAAIAAMQTILTMADTANSITGFSIKYDRPSILKRIAQLEEEVGITTGEPTIRGIQPW